LKCHYCSFTDLNDTRAPSDENSVDAGAII
jgi:hypothetical protein